MAASNNSTNAAYLSALRSSFNRIIHLIDDCSRDSAALEYALFRVDVLYQAVQRFNVLLSDGDAILDRLNNVRQILVAAIDVDEASDQEGYLTDCQISLHKGRPWFKISKEQLDFFVESGFTVPNIAGLLNVSCSTVERRMREFSISVRNKYSSVSDEELDNIILDIKTNFPNTGYKRMNGFLSQRGYTVQHGPMGLARAHILYNKLPSTSTVPCRQQGWKKLLGNLTQIRCRREGGRNGEVKERER